MNPVSNVSSHQGIRFPLEAEEKSEGTGSTEKPLEALVGGRRVSPAEEGNALAAIASTKQDAGVTEPAMRTLLCRRDTVQKAASGAASAMAVDRTGRQSPSELETIDKLQKLAVSPEEKSTNERQEQTMFTAFFMALSNGFGNVIAGLRDGVNEIRKEAMLGVHERRSKVTLEAIHEADKLRGDGKLEEANKVLDPILDRIVKREDGDRFVISSAYRSKAHILCDEKDIENALIFFKKSEQFEDFINFPERLFILHLMLGINVIDGAGSLSLFRPDDFYENIKEWLVDDEKHREGLSEFVKEVEGAGTFFDGIKAVFAEENVGTEASGGATGKSKQSIAKTNFEKTKPADNILLFSEQILRFAKNLRLIKQDNDDEAMANMGQEESCSGHLDDYISCQVLRKSGYLDQAIKKCQQGLAKGYPFSDYLEELRSEKRGSGSVAVAK